MFNEKVGLGVRFQARWGKDWFQRWPADCAEVQPWDSGKPGRRPLLQKAQEPAEALGVPGCLTALYDADRVLGKHIQCDHTRDSQKDKFRIYCC